MNVHSVDRARLDDCRVEPQLGYIDYHVDIFMRAEMTVVYSTGAHKLAVFYDTDIEERLSSESVHPKTNAYFYAQTNYKELY